MVLASWSTPRKAAQLVAANLFLENEMSSSRGPWRLGLQQASRRPHSTDLFRPSARLLAQFLPLASPATKSPLFRCFSQVHWPYSRTTVAIMWLVCSDPIVVKLRALCSSGVLSLCLLFLGAGSILLQIGALVFSRSTVQLSFFCLRSKSS